MPSYHLNETKSNKQPREAAVGQLGADSTIDGVVSSLVAVGVEQDHIYFLVGTDGATALRATSGFLSVFDDVIEKPLSALDAGNTVVGVFGVDKNGAAEVRQALLDAGVTHTHYFGKWTFS